MGDKARRPRKNPIKHNLISMADSSLLQHWEKKGAPGNIRKNANRVEKDKGKGTGLAEGPFFFVGG